MKEFLVAALLWTPVLAAEGPPTHMANGWQRETIPFPLPFAPSIPYQGVEELRFAPGMFDGHSPELWTYGFVWAIKGSTVFTSERLNQDLQVYFEGLIRSREKKADMRAIRVHAALKQIPSSVPGRLKFSGPVESFDPFATHQPIHLNVVTEVVTCSHGSSLVSFKISPQPSGHEVWTQLAEAMAGFKC
jgi:hypothetical protein